MLETVRRLVEQPTQHADVRCTIHSRGLRFVVETHPIRGKSGSNIEHVDWQTLDQCVSALAAETILTEAYNRAVEGADQLLQQGPTVTLHGGPMDGDRVSWSGGDTIKVQEKREVGIGFDPTPRAPRDGIYRRTTRGDFRWAGWETSNG